MPVFRAIAGVTTAALAATVLWAQPARADRYVGFDPARDMVTGAPPGVVVKPNHRDGDIRKVVVRYLPHRLTVRVTYFQLRSPRNGGSGVFLMGFIRTNPRAMPGPFLGEPGGPWQWEAAISSNHPPRMGILDALTEEDFQCFRSGGSDSQGMEARINYRKDFAFVSYPRHCIGGFGGAAPHQPRWVRLSVASAGRGGWDHWIAPNDITFPSFHHAFYATPRLYPG